ncbi:DNA polymerase I, partial [Bacillus licheniformis]
MADKKLMIIDGSSLFFRAFYALPLLKNDKGFYTNAVYGFLTMFFKARKEIRPDYIAIAFDRKAPTFRHVEYE